jgi:hypothetical protein
MVGDLIHETFQGACHKSLPGLPEFGRAGAASGGRSSFQRVERVMPGRCHSRRENGARARIGVDIWSRHSNMLTVNKLREAPFKDFWSDDSKNNYREES